MIQATSDQIMFLFNPIFGLSNVFDLVSIWSLTEGDIIKKLNIDLFLILVRCRPHLSMVFYY